MHRRAALLLALVAATLAAGSATAAASGRWPPGTHRAEDGRGATPFEARSDGKSFAHAFTNPAGEQGFFSGTIDGGLSGTVAARTAPGTSPTRVRAPAAIVDSPAEGRTAPRLGTPGSPFDSSTDSVSSRVAGAMPRPARRAEAQRELLRVARSALREVLLSSRGADVGTESAFGDVVKSLNPAMTKAETLAAARATLERLGLAAPTPDPEVTRVSRQDVAVLPAFSWDIQARWRHAGGSDDAFLEDHVAAEGADGGSVGEGDEDAFGEEWSAVGLNVGLFTKDSSEDVSGRITITSSIDDYGGGDGADDGLEAEAGEEQGAEREGEPRGGDLDEGGRERRAGGRRTSKKRIGDEVLVYEDDAGDATLQQQNLPGAAEDSSRLFPTPPAPVAPQGQFLQILDALNKLSNLYGADESDPWQVPHAGLLLMNSVEGSVGFWASDDPTPRDVLQARPPEVWLYALHTPKYGGDRMLNHFLEHYTRLGIAVDRMVFVVNWGGRDSADDSPTRTIRTQPTDSADDSSIGVGSARLAAVGHASRDPPPSSSFPPRSSEAPALQASLAILDAWGIDYSMWYGQYSSEAHLEHRLRALRRVPVRDWIVLADSDELVDFGGRTAAAAFADADAEGANFVAGRLVDRVARGGKLEVINVPQPRTVEREEHNAISSESDGEATGRGLFVAERSADRSAGAANAAAAGVGSAGVGRVGARSAADASDGQTHPDVSIVSDTRARRRPTTPFGQFPLACDVGGLLAGSSRAKIVAHRGFLRAGAGSHGIILPEHAAKYFAATPPGRRSPRHGYYGASDLFHLTPYAAYWQFYASPSISGNAFLWTPKQASRHARALHFKWNDGVRDSARDRLRHYRGDDQAIGGGGTNATAAATADESPSALPRFHHWIESQRIISQVVERRRVPVWDARLRCKHDRNPVRFPLSSEGRQAVDDGWRAFWKAKEAAERSEQTAARRGKHAIVI